MSSKSDMVNIMQLKALQYLAEIIIFYQREKVVVFLGDTSINGKSKSYTNLAT